MMQTFTIYVYDGADTIKVAIQAATRQLATKLARAYFPDNKFRIVKGTANDAIKP